LATVTITLTTAASWTPRSTSAWTTQRITEVKAMEGRVFPPTKEGMKVPIADPSRTRKATLPIQAPIQYPMAEQYPMKLPNPARAYP